VALEYEDESLHQESRTVFERTRDLPADDRLFGCGAAIIAFHVDPQGMLLPCLMVPSHAYDLRQGSFRAGWDSVLSTFPEQKVSPGYECHVCEKRVICGACPAQFAFETGSPSAKSEYLCQLGEARLRALGIDR